MSRIALVWLKRDLRTRDHAPLAAAAHFDAALALFIIEPQWLNSPECDAQHVAFAAACIGPLQQTLAQRGLPLLIRCGSAVDVLQALRVRTGFTALLSHEETGPGWTYARDRQVAAWCRAQGVTWDEFAQTGVIRRLRSRAGWAARWQARMDAAEVTMPERWCAPARVPPAQRFPTLAELHLCATRPLPQAGERAALHTLDSFLEDRGASYRKALSSPLTAEQGCSRLSPHLAFGTVSMRVVHQATERRIQALRATASTDALEFAKHLRGFSGRLRWHCHFVQKLEDEPGIEWRNFARVCDGLRESDFDTSRFEAWCEGRTGFPMVDACMRSLRATGWLNFRMRAMLVSFAAYHLWLHWREPGRFLARQFLDFEPGIHWSQMQMQSGTTGINTVRIYSPTKQAADHDPLGRFVRRWVPEWGTRDYPPPIVDEKLALARAKQRVYALRALPQARAQAAAIQAKHGSRKSGLPPSALRGRRKRVAEDGALGNQRELFE